MSSTLCLREYNTRHNMPEMLVDKSIYLSAQFVGSESKKSIFCKQTALYYIMKLIQQQLVLSK
jgi:hypothetical protein